MFPLNRVPFFLSSEHAQRRRSPFIPISRIPNQIPTSPLIPPFIPFFRFLCLSLRADCFIVSQRVSVCFADRLLSTFSFAFLSFFPSLHDAYLFLIFSVSTHSQHSEYLCLGLMTLPLRKRLFPLYLPLPGAVGTVPLCFLPLKDRCSHHASIVSPFPFPRFFSMFLFIRFDRYTQASV